MGTVGQTGYRVQRRYIARYWLWRALIAEYRKTDTYQNRVRCDLRPKWQGIAAQHGWEWPTPLDDVRIAASQAERDGELSEYLRLLGVTVRDFMGLKVDGSPARWALGYVHADAECPRDGRPFDPGTGGRRVWHEFSLRVIVTDAYGEVTVRRDAGPDQASLGQLRMPDDTVFDRWEDLKAQARRQLDDELKRLKDTLTHAYGDRQEFARSNIRTLDRSDDLRDLCSLLMKPLRSRVKPDGATWARRARLARAIGIDPPSYSDKS